MKFFYKDKDIGFMSKEKILNIKEKKPKKLIAKYKFTKDVNSATELYKLDKPTVFNGTSFIDTGIQLLKQDTDWTIFADFIPSAYNGAGQCIFHCLDESNPYPGMSLSTEISYVQFWNGTTHNVRLTDDSYAGKKIRVVIVKNGSETTVYHSNNDSMYQTASPTTYAYTFRETNSTLSIGAGHAEDAICYPFTGTINDFVIYNGVLSEQECNSLIANGTIDLFPEFNEGFEYTYEDIVEENIITRTIYANSLPAKIQFGSTTSNPNTMSLLQVLYLNADNLNDMSLMFYNCTNLTSVNTSNWDTSKVVTMAGTFYNCQSLVELNIKDWDTRNVQWFNGMFYNCKLLTTLEISNWDTRNVIDMNALFYSCTKLVQLDINKWDVSKVTSMSNMFNGCTSLVSIGNVSNWDTSEVTNMNYMFANCRLLTSLDTNNWDTSKVANMDYMFYKCYNLTELNVNNFNTSNVNNMNGMFYGCTNLTSLNVNNWNTGKVRYMSDMFRDCQALTSLDVFNWETGNVTTMNSMFLGCKLLTQLDVTSFRLTNCESIKDMFGYCDNLETIIFSNDFCTSGALTDMQGVFVKCKSLKSLDLSNWNISNVTIMSWALQECTALTTLNISNWRLNDTIAIQQIFMDSPNIKTIIMNNSNYNSINKIISVLPTRTSDSIGTLNIEGIDDISQVDITTVNSKYWTIVSHTILNNARLGQTKLN